MLTHLFYILSCFVYCCSLIIIEERRTNSWPVHYIHLLGHSKHFLSLNFHKIVKSCPFRLVLWHKFNLVWQLSIMILSLYLSFSLLKRKQVFVIKYLPSYFQMEMHDLVNPSYKKYIWMGRKPQIYSLISLWIKYTVLKLTRWNTWQNQHMPRNSIY